MSNETTITEVTTPEAGENPSESKLRGNTDVSGDNTDNAGERKPPREARYRVERNQAREERDALAEQVRELQRRDAERLAARGLSQPADLFALGGVELGDLLDDSGFVDPDKVSEVVSDILGSRPGLRASDRAVDPSQGLGGDSRPELSWSSFFRSGVSA
ncbi:hypothetical protein [Mycolicibacter sinensis]|uniref:hypothetical protein n=1 Tax=Mycolicibacter sinensis (strain JDM601) TaxID=875328 RepID=UPI0010421338|nr:hypothetical protein [Mycolicibacter sinensis]